MSDYTQNMTPIQKELFDNINYVAERNPNDEKVSIEICKGDAKHRCSLINWYGNKLYYFENTKDNLIFELIIPKSR